MRLWRGFALGLPAAFVASLPALAEPVDLAGAVARALDVSPVLAEAEAGQAQARAALDAIHASRGFQIGAQASIGVQETDFSTGTASQTPRIVGIEGRMPLYTSGALPARIAAAGHSLEASGLRLASAREQVAFAAVDAYTAVWLAGRDVAVVGRRAETLAQRLAEARRGQDLGVLTQTDVSLTEAREAGAQAELAAAVATLTAAKARLSALTGLVDPEPSTIPELSGAPAADVEAFVALALSASPDVSAAGAGVRAADARGAETSARFGPQVTITARASYAEEPFFFFNETVSDIGAFVRVEAPLFTNGLRSAQEDEARAGRSAARAAERSVRLSLEETVRSLWAEREGQLRALAAARRAEAAAEIAAEGAAREADAGLRTSLDALEAADELRDASLSRTRAEARLVLTEARLHALSGGLADTILQTR